jgi:hypothetical protein
MESHGIVSPLRGLRKEERGWGEGFRGLDSRGANLRTPARRLSSLRDFQLNRCAMRANAQPRTCLRQGFGKAGGYATLKTGGHIGPPLQDEEVKRGRLTYTEEDTSRMSDLL